MSDSKEKAEEAMEKLSSLAAVTHPFYVAWLCVVEAYIRELEEQLKLRS